MKTLQRIYCILKRPILYAIITLIVVNIIDSFWPNKLLNLVLIIYNNLPIINISKESFSQLIDIFLAIGTLLFALAALLSNSNLNDKVKENNNTIKTFLENLSSTYCLNKNKLSYMYISQNIYDLELKFSQYNSLIDESSNINTQIKKSNILNEKISDFAFTLYFFSFLLWILCLIVEQSNIFSSINYILLIFYIISAINLISWDYYRKDFLELIKPKNSNISFPSLNKLLNLSETINLPCSNIYPLLPINLFSNTSYFELKDDLLNNLSYMNLVTVQDFNIYGIIEVNISDNQKYCYKLNSKDYMNNNGTYSFDLENIHSKDINNIRIVIKNTIDNTVYNTNLLYKREDKNIFIFSNMISVKEQASIIPINQKLNLIKPITRNTNKTSQC